MKKTDYNPPEYDGPIQAADGTRPRNWYLWPTEAWWVTHQPQFRNVWGQYHFGYVALADGQYATDGSVFAIDRNCDSYDMPCVFATRTQAIRTSAARMIMQMRWAMRCERPQQGNNVKTVQAMINWTLNTVAEECKSPAPRSVTLPVPPPPPAPRPEDGLPLFECTHNVALSVNVDRRGSCIAGIRDARHCTFQRIAPEPACRAVPSYMLPPGERLEPVRMRPLALISV